MLNEQSRRVFVWTIIVAILVGSMNPHLLIAQSWFTREATTVQKLASQIDKLQAHIDRYGSIVAKDPDVWGQSRLMTHRVEFEEQMREKLDDFEFRLNAAEFTRDAAFLSQALSLQASLDGRATENLPAPVATAASGSTTTIVIPNLANPNAASTADGNNAFVPRTGFSSGFQTIKGSDGAAINVGIEPTIELDQMKRYLDHLNEIRRLNEGDDTADSPGYALHLVRVPVSVLPGKQTHKGYGAEITMTIQPQLSEELLPNAFRDFVINGVRDRIAPQVLSIADRWDMSLIRETLDEIYEDKDSDKASNAYSSEFYGAYEKWPANGFSTEGTESQGKALIASNNEGRLAISRNGRLSLATTHNPFVNGITLFRVGLDAFDNLAVPEAAIPNRDSMPAGRRSLHYQNVAEFLTVELQASYDFLATPAAAILWNEHCGPELALAIREVRRSISDSRREKIVDRGYSTNDNITQEIKTRRTEFFHTLETFFPEAKDSTTANLAWHIIVESALLNEQLVDDMKNLAAERNAWCLTTDWLPYYGPHPPMEARMAFNEYVKARWPIHVFALDPVTQDQNVAAGFSQRREMQLLLAIAASRRFISLQSLTQFVRRLEYDLETIELNRTAIGFTHGSDTFGWRFYPRVQVPEVKSNLNAAVHDLLIGGPNRDDRIDDRRLEPGIRECTALVVMPSFVPNVILDTRSDWFKLADHLGPLPRRFLNRKGQVRDAVDLSAEVVELRRLSHACTTDAHLYREGEVYRLQRAVHTLDRTLPLQTAFVEMPYENLLGGFDLFNSSVLGLKPTLRGWYGAPGIVVKDGDAAVQEVSNRIRALSRKLAELKALQARKLVADPQDTGLSKLKEDITSVDGAITQAVSDLNSLRAVPSTQTTLYLVGKNFSVLDTRVIAGGKEIPESDVKLISRDVIQVTVPGSVSPVNENGRPYVDVHLATPYGPTPRLRIPVANDVSASAAAAAASAAAASKHADAAKASAEQAVKASPGFEWQKDTLAVTYQDPFSVARLQWNGTDRPNIAYKNPNPFVSVPSGPEVEFAFFLSVKNKGQTQAEPLRDAQQRKIGVSLAKTFSGTHVGQDVIAYSLHSHVPPALPAEQLLEAIKSVLALHQGEIEELIVDGYLRIHEDVPVLPNPPPTPHYDALPVIHLKELKISVVKPTTKATAGSTTAPAAGAGVGSAAVETPFTPRLSVQPSWFSGSTPALQVPRVVNRRAAATETR